MKLMLPTLTRWPHDRQAIMTRCYSNTFDGLNKATVESCIANSPREIDILIQKFVADEDSYASLIQNLKVEASKLYWPELISGSRLHYHVNDIMDL